MSTKKTILVVEDDFEIREIIQDTLELEGYRTLPAGNGKEALEVLSTHRPDLMLIDLMMPIMNGWELIDEIKKDPRLNKIPLMVVSAFVEKKDTVTCDAFLEKPIQLNGLLNLVHQLTE